MIQEQAELIEGLLEDNEMLLDLLAKYQEEHLRRINLCDILLGVKLNILMHCITFVLMIIMLWWL